MDLSGILVVDKPAGPTSFDVVSRVRSLLQVSKVGHTGTLDPAATGVLPICLGSATRIAGFLTEGDKGYEAVARLGETTDTQDATGQVLEKRPLGDLTEARLRATVERFVGTIQQVPPMYSAVKVEGKRLYELARAGQEVERAARPVKVYELELLEVALPDFRFRVRCSKGTYVRTLAHDIGQALGVGAHLRTLRRTQSGPFTLERAVVMDKLEALGPARRAEAAKWVLPLAEAFADLPTIQLDAHTLTRRVAHGQPLDLPKALHEVGEGERVRVLGPDGSLAALAERRGPQLRYLRVLVGGA